MHFDLHIPIFLRRGVHPQRVRRRGDVIARGRAGGSHPFAARSLAVRALRRGRQRDWPSLPYTLLADGGAPSGISGCADPVHLRVGRDSLVLRRRAAFQVSRAESRGARSKRSTGHFGRRCSSTPCGQRAGTCALEKAPDMQDHAGCRGARPLRSMKRSSRPDAMRASLRS